MNKINVFNMIALCGVLLLAGCASTGGGGDDPSDAVAKEVDGYLKALQAQDIDAIMKHFSENFDHYEWGDKEGTRNFLAGLIEQGYMEGLEVDKGKMDIDVEGTEATAYPVFLSGSFGQVTLELNYTKDAKGWAIIGLESSGV